MSSLAEVKLWGRTIGAVYLDPSNQTADFEFQRDFQSSGIQLSPLVMPLSPKIYSFPQLPQNTFRGLPGLLADSLPDRFGNALIDAWLATQGRSPDSFNAIERLCYTGSRGMGALEFAPALGPKSRKAQQIEIDQLVALASTILQERDELHGSFSSGHTEEALKDILRIGTSAGGARAKAVIAWNPETNEVRSGQVDADPGFEHWLLKFDGVTGNRDKELADPKGYGVVEYAYHRMAVAAGITMNPCRLLEENKRRHFMTRRFDRPSGKEKLHMQSLCALAHFDFNLAGAYGYEQVFQIIRQLGLGMASIEEQFRRMVFNVMARNQDDHVKNIAFLMDKSGQWSLAPAFDVIYSYNPTGKWTSIHQMSLNGKRDEFTMEDFIRCGKRISIQKNRLLRMIEIVRDAVSRWSVFAQEAGLNRQWSKQIEKNLRLIR